METVHTEETRGGLTIKIIQDQDAQSPNEWGDENLFILGFDSRNFWIERKGYSEGLITAAMSGGRYEDGSIYEEARELRREFHILPVRAYIHSGVSLSLEAEGQYADQWDSAWIGVILASKKEWKTEKEARKAAKGLIEEWNNYLMGNVYGYQVIDEDGEEVASLWGIYGYYDEAGGALDQAKEAAGEYLKRRKRFRVTLNAPFVFEVKGKTKAEAFANAMYEAAKQGICKRINVPVLKKGDITEIE